MTKTCMTPTCDMFILEAFRDGIEQHRRHAVDRPEHERESQQTHGDGGVAWMAAIEIMYILLCGIWYALLGYDLFRSV